MSMTPMEIAVIAAALRNPNILLEDRMEFLHKHYTEKGLSTAHDPNAEHKITARPGSPEHYEQVGKVLNFWAQHDPTPNKQYVGRVAHWYSKGDIRQEDHPRVKSALEGFHHFKSKLEQKDINQYPSFNSLEAEVDKVKGSGAQTKSDVRTADEQTIDRHSKVIHRSPELTVRSIPSGGHEAMAILSRNTKWCISNKNTFEGYAKRGPLYFMHDKKENKKYLYHPESDQLMKEDDTRADHNELAKKHPVLRDVLHGKGQHFTDPERLHGDLKAGRHVETGVREWMAKNTDHQGLLTHLLNEHPSDVLSNRHFKNWGHVRQLLKEK